MKTLLLLPFLLSALAPMAPRDGSKDENGKILVDNDKVTVVEFVGAPQAAVCGAGMHFHKPHLTVALTDARVLITSPDGQTQNAEIPKGAAIWFDAGTHEAINAGNDETKLLLVYLKE